MGEHITRQLSPLKGAFPILEGRVEQLKGQEGLNSALIRIGDEVLETD